MSLRNQGNPLPCNIKHVIIDEARDVEKLLLIIHSLN